MAERRDKKTLNHALKPIVALPGCSGLYFGSAKLPSTRHSI
jgi:hypothetical protein